MEFSNIKPFARFVRHLEISKNTVFPKSIPMDARIFYVVEGKGKIEIDGEIFTMPIGSVLYINAGQSYRLMPCDVVYLVVNFDFTFEHSHIETPVPPVNANLLQGEKPFERHEFTDADYFNNYCFFTDFHSLQINLLKLEKEYTRKLPFYLQECSNILSSLLTAIVRRAQGRASKENRFEIEEVLKYLEKHYNEHLDNKTIGEIFHFHPNYISAEFKRYTGKTLHQFVLETRILNAVSLIESGCDNIQEISNLTGFYDRNYFSRYFKQIMGVSPAKYICTCVEK